MSAVALRGRALALAGIVALAVAVAAFPARAEEPAAVGWWWMGHPSGALPAAVSPVPEPPEGGLYVGGGPSGPVGISALRFELGPDTTASTLRLVVAEATGTIAIDACPAKEPWEPTENGSWDEGPEPDCDARSVTATVNEEQTEVTLLLLPLQGADGVIDIVLVPGEDPETLRPANFSAAFEPLAPDALAVTEPADTEPADTDPSTADPSTGASTPPRPRAAEPPRGPALTSPGLTATGPEPSTSPSVDAPRVAAPPDSEPTQVGANTAAMASFPVEESVLYPAVLALPLVLLIAASYFGWTLTSPVMASRGPGERPR